MNVSVSFHDSPGKYISHFYSFKSFISLIGIEVIVDDKWNSPLNLNMINLLSFLELNRQLEILFSVFGVFVKWHEKSPAEFWVSDRAVREKYYLRSFKNKRSGTIRNILPKYLEQIIAFSKLSSVFLLITDYKVVGNGRLNEQVLTCFFQETRKNGEYSNNFN